MNSCRLSLTDEDYDKHQYDDGENERSLRGLRWDGAALRKVGNTLSGYDCVFYWTPRMKIVHDHIHIRSECMQSEGVDVVGYDVSTSATPLAMHLLWCVLNLHQFTDSNTFYRFNSYTVIVDLFQSVGDIFQSLHVVCCFFYLPNVQHV